MKGAETGPMEVTEAERPGSSREAVAESSRRRGPERRNTNRQRGRARAASVLGNAKPKIHQDASGRAGRHGPRVVGLTRGGLPGESGGGVSRGRSSEESRGNPAGAKGRRNQRETIRSIALGGKTAATSTGPVVKNETRNEPWRARREAPEPGRGEANPQRA